MKPVVLAIVNGWELAATAPVIADARAEAEGHVVHLLLWQSREADMECMVPLPLLDFRICRLWGLHEDLRNVQARFLYASTATLLKRVAALEPQQIFMGEAAAGYPHGNTAQVAASQSMQTRLEAMYPADRLHTCATPSPGLLVEDWQDARPYWMSGDISFSPEDAARLYPPVVDIQTERFEQCSAMRNTVLRRFARRADMLDIPREDRA